MAVAETDTGLSALRRMLAPSSVAVVGASPREGALSSRFVSGLLRHGFPGRVVPVNPNYDEVEGLPCAPSVLEAGLIDLAVLAIPKRLVLESLEECAAAGVAGVVVFASGFAETGAEGAAEEQRIAARARASGLRVLGPNSPGFLNITHRCCVIASGVSFRDHFFGGGVAVLAQSGGVAGLLTERAQDRGVGLSQVICTGNEADITVGELLSYLAEDEATKAVAVFLETVRDGDSFTAGLRALREAGKGAVVLRVGATELAARASQAHTGALATADDVFDAVLARYRAVRARDADELIDTAAALAAYGPARSRAVGIVSTSGGAGVLATEAAEQAGLALPALTDNTRAALAAVTPDFASLANPADMSGMFVENPGIFRGSLAVFLRAKEVEAVVLVLTVQPPALADELAQRTIDAARGCRKPLCVLWMAGAMSEPARRRLRRAGLLVFEHPERCMRALAARAELGRPLPEAINVVVGRRPPPRHRAALEHEALALVAEAGIAVVETRFCHTAEEARAAAVELGGPVAVKACARDLPHKAAVGAVALHPDDPEEAFLRVTQAARAAGATVEGAIVQRLADPGVETIVGVRIDRTFGPVLVAGLGGAGVEAQVAVGRRLLPLARGEAEELAAILPAGDRRAFAAAIEAIAAIALSFGERLDALEVNPLIVHEQGVVAVDALALFTEEDAL